MASEEPAAEVVQGEVVPAPRPNPRLTPQQLQAAIADASGATRNDIATMVGVSASAVKQWRQKPEYAGEVERLKSMQADVVLDAVKKMRDNLVDGTNEAITTLKGLLEAVDSRGKPAYGVRQRAAETLLQYGIELDKETRAAVGGGRAAQVPANQAIVVVLKDE